MRTLAKLIAWLAATALLLLCGGYVALFIVVDRRYDETVARFHGAFARHHAQVIADQGALEGKLFQSRTGGDAGPLLNPRVFASFEKIVPEDVRTRWRAGSPVGFSLALSDEAWKQLGDEKGWFNTSAALWWDMDFSWMKGLDRYGYWDIEADGIPASPLHAGFFTDDYQSLFTLERWVRARMLKGALDDDLPGAVHEVRELARLALTTETLWSGLIAERILHDERAFYDVPPWGNRRPPGWSPPDKAQLGRLFRSASAVLWYGQLDTPAASQNELSRLPFGRCEAINWGLEIARIVRPALGTSRAESYERLGRLLEAANECRLTRMRKLWPTQVDPVTERWFYEAYITPHLSFAPASLRPALVSSMLVLPGGKRLMAEWVLSTGFYHPLAFFRYETAREGSTSN